MSFGLFDPQAEYTVVWRHLPHWEQPGATYFITWRTLDSLPRPVLQGWIAEREEWLRKRRLAVTPGDLALPPRLVAEYRAFISKRWESRLDECHGECVLRQPELARLVADSLRHFDGERYALGDFVVMPNHVHVLVCFPNERQLREQCRSWKKYTATQINKRLGRRGEFWQDESYDHLVRSQDEFDTYRAYIAGNPSLANLDPCSCLMYRAPDPVTE